MTQQVYRMELNERELRQLIELLDGSAFIRDTRKDVTALEFTFVNRLRALEPVGTEGGS